MTDPLPPPSPSQPTRPSQPHVTKLHTPHRVALRVEAPHRAHKLGAAGSQSWRSLTGGGAERHRPPIGSPELRSRDRDGTDQRMVAERLAELS